MKMNPIFGSTIQLAEKALNLRSKWYDLIVSNIANADTPGYKAFDLIVQEALQRQTDNGDRLSLNQTHGAHLASRPDVRSSDHVRKLQTDATVSLRGDGNTVDMDREMANLAANEMMYKAAAQVISKKFQFLKTVIQGGKR